MSFQILTRCLVSNVGGNLLKRTTACTTNVSLFKAFSRSVILNTDKSSFKFTDKHEWISVKDNIGTVGITDYAQDKLGEVVFVELPELGVKLDASSQFATLESVKAVSECYLPVSGTVKEVNASVIENPSQINKEPFAQGWLVKIELSNKTDVDKLMNEQQYNEFLKSESH